MLEQSSDKQAAQIREAAIRLLARREHSQVELIRKLSQKGFEYATCESAVQQLREQGYQSDLRFAQMFIRSRAARFYGQVRIAEELKQHQVAGAETRQAFAELEIDWFELCKEAFERKFRDKASEDWQARQKQKRYLWQRGFSEDQIQYALSSE